MEKNITRPEPHGHHRTEKLSSFCKDTKIIKMSSALCLQSFSYTPISYSLNPTSTNKNGVQTPSFTTFKSKDFSGASSSDQHRQVSQPNGTVKVPTAPWMKGPLKLQPHELTNLSEPRSKNRSKNASIGNSDKALTEKESGVRGKKAMKGIVKSIERLRKDPKERNLRDTQVSLEGFEMGEGLRRIGGHDGELSGNKKLPWVRKERVLIWRAKKERVVTKAELSLDRELLRRLREEAAKIRKWVKVKKAGVTQDVVDQIRYDWRRTELAMVKFDVPLCWSMNRAREILEMKTGGMVVWTKKDTHVIYKGHNHRFWKSIPDERCSELGSIPSGILMEDLNTQPLHSSLFERETDRLLDGLGPRYVDWWMRKPLPVDGDLLPEVVPGFRPPSRLCPSVARSQLKDVELTYLRKVAYALPTHFVLGRNRRLQGLAAAILKLWEKSIIAKIAIKWGVPNTDNEQMANELKHLTGGVLLLRNKFFVIIYRGKDFLPCKVADLIADREMELNRCQQNEEDARLKAVETFFIGDEQLATSNEVGTLSEFQNIQITFGEQATVISESELGLEAEKIKLEKELSTQEHKLSILKCKIEKSERELLKLNSAWTPADKDADEEIITEEERECFRKIGLKMHSNLVLGRRGIFDGVIEGIHQHWKHREVVKVITMQRAYARIIFTAKSLEAETGGILVSVDRLKEGHAIIIYRGRNYKRPLKLHVRSLLTKREALRRSLLMQRIGSLKFFAYQRQRAISEVTVKLAQLRKSEGKKV